MYIIVISTRNNRDWESPCWRTVTEKDTLREAKSVFDNYVQLSDERATDYLARPGNNPITQVAVFRLAGGDTFGKKAQYYRDNRDKSDWPLTVRPEVSGLVNATNSDFGINWKK